MLQVMNRFQRSLPKPGRNEVYPAVRGGGDCRYNPELVEFLHEDHLRILGLLEEIELLLNKDRLASAGKLLSELRYLLKTHQVREDVRMVKYLEQRLLGDGARLERLRLFRVERERVNQEIDAFLRKYQSIAIQPGLKGLFRQELGRLGDTLVAQFEREESELHALYRDAG